MLEFPAWMMLFFPSAVPTDWIQLFWDAASVAGFHVPEAIGCTPDQSIGVSLLMKSPQACGPISDGNYPLSELGGCFSHSGSLPSSMAKRFPISCTATFAAAMVFWRLFLPRFSPSTMLPL